MASIIGRKMSSNSDTDQQPLTHLSQITSDWLTAALTRSGAITRGAVASFELDSGQGHWSANATISINYTADAQGALPRKLFLKMVKTDLDGESFSESEVTYYARDYVNVPHAPLLRCYHAVYSAEQQRYHLLLDDVSETHRTAKHQTPTLEYGLALAEALAILHAGWWGAKVGTSMHSAAHIKNFVAIAEPGCEHILQHCSAELAPQAATLLRDLFVHHPQALIARAQDKAGFTLIHGDVGAGNILVPHSGARPLYLIDRQPFNWSLTTWLGVYDLAYAVVLDWPTEIRRQCERAMLEQYHVQLNQEGVRDYSWERVLSDYRLCVAMSVYIATEYCRGGINERWRPVWWAMLQRALTACKDWECQALW